MRSLGAFALALALAPAGLQAADGVTLHYRPLQAGDDYRTTSGGLFDFDMTVSGGGKTLGSQKMNLRMAESYKVDVLDANASGPIRVKVRYFQSESTTTLEAGQAKKEAEPVAGKTYLVTVTDGELRVTDEKGGPVDEEQSAKVSQDMGSLGKPDPVCKYLDGRTVAIGETLEPSAEIVGGFLGAGGQDDQVEGLTLTLREVAKRRGAPAAVFELQVRISSHMEDGTAISIRAAGEATMAVDDCRPLSMELYGPMTMNGTTEAQGQQIDLKGTGRARIVMRLEYEPR